MSRAGVMSRPATQGSTRLPNLPTIQHPLSAMSPGPAQMDVVAGNAPLSKPGSRPLAAEQDYKIPKRLNTSGSRASNADNGLQVQNKVETIPEGVQVTQGDPSKTKLPIFGNKSQLGSRDEMLSRASTRLSQASTQSRLEVDELESIIRERCRTQFHGVQKQFKDNDPQGQGNVNKDALLRIITIITGKQISQQLYQKLLHRIGLQDRNIVHFSDFFSKFRVIPNSAKYPQWMTSINKNLSGHPILNANQVHALLKEKARQRVLDVADLVPQTNPEGAKRLLKPEFRNALNRLMFAMNDDEFEKLWTKYDEQNIGVIDGVKFMKKLGISMSDPRNGSSGNVDLPDTFNPQPETPPPSEPSPRRKESDRQRSLNIERWLKNKFREGFLGMRLAFEEFDSNKTGIVPSNDFCSVLGQYGLKLDRKYLDEFLARCGASQTKLGVPYKEFLLRFQDRSEDGMPHKILGDHKHRYNKSVRSGSPDVKSTLSAIEAHLMGLFQKDFLSLIGTFHKIDRIGADVISQEEFRAAIESRFDIEMTDEQFRNLIDHVPLTHDGDVKYAEFMAQFDTRGDTKSLFSTSAIREAPVKVTEQGFNSLILDDEGHEKRDVDTLLAIVRNLFKRKYKEIERKFSEMEEFNSQRLSQETLYQLLKTFDINPPMNRGEIRELWKTFLTNKDGKLEWLQFVRTFGYSKRSAAFPNAKISPPKKGDSDLTKKSRILSSDFDLLQDSMRQKIDYLWDSLRKEFFEMDPYGTGFVSGDEFRAVLSELCVQLTELELNEICRKFTARDGRVSYIEFLRPFAMKREVWKHGNDMQVLLAHVTQELPIADIVEPPHKGLVGISAKLRQKLSGDWKNLRRAFKKLDKTGQGYLTLPEFRNVLKLTNVVLDEDDVYNVMHTFDEDLSGRINYNKFLSETFRPDTKGSQKK